MIQTVYNDFISLALLYKKTHTQRIKAVAGIAFANHINGLKLLFTANFCYMSTYTFSAYILLSVADPPTAVRDGPARLLLVHIDQGERSMNEQQTEWPKLLYCRTEKLVRKYLTYVSPTSWTLPIYCSTKSSILILDERFRYYGRSNLKIKMKEKRVRLVAPSGCRRGKLAASYVF